jgi:hypothetical protein
MSKLKEAALLQQELLSKGFKAIDFYDIQDHGPVEIHHYLLSKNDEIAKPDSCIFYESIDLKSQKALEVIAEWLTQIKIKPDPRSI